MEDLKDKSSREDLSSFARRIVVLEDRIDRLEGRRPDAQGVHPAWPLILGVSAAVLGVLGMGVPRHPYQYLFGGLLLLLAYHRRFLLPADGWWKWPLTATNAVNLVLFFLVVLGGGIRYPLLWLKAPGVVKQTQPDSGAWYDRMLPDYDLQWHMIPGVTDWSMDLTKVQVFLLIMTLIGVLFRFQGFASIMALALFIVSIPVYLTFTWDWVVLFLIFGSVSLYLQTSQTDAYRLTGRHGR